MIIFKEHTSSDYASRSIINANADITFAFAIDFSSKGEILTKKSCIKQNRIYKPINLNICKLHEHEIRDILYSISTRNIYDNELIINIAGNSIFTFKDFICQNDLDNLIEVYLSQILGKIWLTGIYKKIKIISGGQTGSDESGLKYGNKYGYETICLSPKGWKFRNILGIDISNEKLFKERFL